MKNQLPIQVEKNIKSVVITTDNHGQAMEPSQTVPSLQLIDTEIKHATNPLHDRADLSPAAVVELVPWLAQARAALQEPNFEAVVTILTRLRLQMPTQKMTETEFSVFLQDRYDIIKIYGFFAISKGIAEILRSSDVGKYFPSPEIMHRFMAPRNAKVKARAAMVQSMLERVAGCKP